jgi:hypothetical protein
MSNCDRELVEAFGLEVQPISTRAMTLTRASKLLAKHLPCFQIEVKFWQFAPERQTLEYVVYDAGRQEHFRGASLQAAVALAIAQSKTTVSEKALDRADQVLSEVPLVAA